MKTNSKLREALKEIRRAMMLDSGCGPTTELHVVVDSITQTALSEPVKNYEVGTAKEQSERYNKFCRVHRSYEKCCGGCPLNGEPCCELAWAQMPYEANEKGEADDTNG